MVKHTQTIRRLLPTNCLSVFDHFVGLALKELTHFWPMSPFYTPMFLGGIKTLKQRTLIFKKYSEKNAYIKCN